jgi:hypothetical protein
MFILSLIADTITQPIPTDISAQVVASALTVWLIQWIKKIKQIPWISDDSAKLNRLISALLAAGTAVGIHATFNNGTLVITGLTLLGILTAAFNWLKAFVMNELIYQAAYNRLPAPPTPVLTRYTQTGEKEKEIKPL